MIRRFFWSGLFLCILDLYLLYRIGCACGFWPVVGILFLPAYFGLRVVLRQGLHCMGRIQEELAAGRNPSQKAAEAPLILISGLLLLMPGPVSTVLGVLLLVPGLRRYLARRMLSGRLPAGVVETGRTAGPDGDVFVRVVQIGGAGGAPRAAPPGIKDVDAREVDSGSGSETPRALPGGRE